MICSGIQYENFRNLAAVEVTFESDINVLWGNNAQGKSNILEGIYYFARGRSFRGAKDRELIRFGHPLARVTMQSLREGAKHATELSVAIPEAGRKRITRGGAVITPAEMIGSFRAVLFCPAHLTLVSGAPALRRSFLDTAIAQLSPAYLDLLSRYNKVLDERTALLKDAADGMPVSREQWQVYAEQLAHYGAGIASCRLAYIGRLNEKMRAYLGEMTAGRERSSLSYDSHLYGGIVPAEDASLSLAPVFDPAAEERLKIKLTEAIDREIRAKATLWGVHKDDMPILLSDTDARLYASQGQQRSIALALKLAEGEISSDVSGECPVFLLDDVLSELDGERRAYVLGALTNRQIIVTSCEPSLFDTAGSSVTMIRVENGTVTRL